MHVDSSLKKQLEAKYGDEQVFVVPLAETLNISDKFTHTKVLLTDLRRWDAKGKYVLRSDAEYNPSLQQLIPYVVILDVTGTKFYVSRRIAGDDRLKGSFSLGFGGHINPIDGSNNVILAAFERELDEEVFIKRKKTPVKFIGHVRDLDSTTKDHLGFVFTVQARYVKIKEDTVLEGSWMSLQDLVDNYHKFESWARYIIDFFFVMQQKKPA
jgi:predicted NUDIX family phosphoesterase